MQFDRILFRLAAVVILTTSVLWAQLPEAMAASVAKPATGGLAAQTRLARATDTHKKKARKAKRSKKGGRKASKKSRKKPVSA